MKTWVTAKLVPLAFDFAEYGLQKPAPAKPTKVRALADYSDNKIESH